MQVPCVGKDVGAKGCFAAANTALADAGEGNVLPNYAFLAALGRLLTHTTYCSLLNIS